MAEQTLDVRVQTLEGEGFQKNQMDQKDQMDQMDQKLQKNQKHQKIQKDQKDQMLDGVQWPSTRGNQITSRDARARIRTLQEFCVFCCHKCHPNTITHYIIIIYIDFRNNFPHCHTFTLLLHPKKSPKHHPQTIFRPPIKNNPSLSTKRHVVFSKTTRHFP